MTLLSRKVLKLEKSDAAGLGYLTAALFLAPYKLSGKNLCPHASKGCAAACLFTAGRGRYDRVKQARLKRSHWYLQDRNGFLRQLEGDIARFARYCRKRNQKAAIRLNGTSDIGWERVAPHFFTSFPDVQFYDYTKSLKRMLAFLSGEFPKNYHLTFSRSESNENDCITVLAKGGNVAAVFENRPSEWQGHPVYDADKTDLRFLDPPGVGGLSMKGRARHDRTGFVIRSGVQAKSSRPIPSRAA